MPVTDWAAFGGDVLVFVGLGVTYGVYRNQAFNSVMQRVDSTLAILLAVRNGVTPWGDLYFAGGYDNDSAARRAEQDHAAVMAHGYAQVYRVPAEALYELVQGSSDGGPLVSRKTIEAANVALWSIGVFNQLVQQQSDFNAVHQADISDESLSPTCREALAKAAEKMSVFIHLRGIGDVTWYAELKTAIDENIRQLETTKSKRWWHRRALRVNAE